MSASQPLVARLPVCTEEVCITCSDQLLAVQLDWVSDDGRLARGTFEGSPCEIDVELVDGVAPGDVVLAQAGVALQRADGVAEGRA